jgi:hypothetical protein
MTATVKILSALAEPKYDTPKHPNGNGAAGLIECQVNGGRIINLHVDGSLADAVVRGQVLALCEAVGLSNDEARPLMEKASRMFAESLAANRANRRN